MRISSKEILSGERIQSVNIDYYKKMYPSPLNKEKSIFEDDIFYL